MVTLLLVLKTVNCCSSHMSVNCVFECCRQGICTASAFIFFSLYLVRAPLSILYTMPPTTHRGAHTGRRGRPAGSASVVPAAPHRKRSLTAGASQPARTAPNHRGTLSQRRSRTASHHSTSSAQPSPPPRDQGEDYHAREDLLQLIRQEFRALTHQAHPGSSCPGPGHLQPHSPHHSHAS